MQCKGDSTACSGAMRSPSVKPKLGPRRKCLVHCFCFQSGSQTWPASYASSQFIGFCRSFRNNWIFWISLALLLPCDVAVKRFRRPLQGQQRSPSFLLPKQSDRPTSRTLAVGRANSDRLHPKTSPFCIEYVTKTGENVRKENSQLRFAVQPAVLRSARVTP